MKHLATWTVAAVMVAGSALFAAPQAAAPQKAPEVLVPAGTVINVRLTQAIDVDAAQAGNMFKGRVDDPISVDGRVVIPREAAVSVQAVKVAQSGGLKGSDQISLKLNTLSVGGRAYQIATEYASVEGKGEGKKTARKVGGGAGLGALVGGIAGGGEGALIGAAVGAVAGTAVAASGEEHLKLDAETRLQFKLSSPVRIQTQP